MADTAAKVQLVSSPTSGTSPPLSPPLTPPAQEEDALSLQELIDSELALRISTDTIEEDLEEDEPSSEVKPPLEVKKLDLLNLRVDDEDSIEVKSDPVDIQPGVVDIQDLIEVKSDLVDIQPDLVDFQDSIEVKYNPVDFQDSIEVKYNPVDIEPDLVDFQDSIEVTSEAVDIQPELVDFQDSIEVKCDPVDVMPNLVDFEVKNDLVDFELKSELPDVEPKPSDMSLADEIMNATHFVKDEAFPPEAEQNLDDVQTAEDSLDTQPNLEIDLLGLESKLEREESGEEEEVSLGAKVNVEDDVRIPDEDTDEGVSLEELHNGHGSDSIDWEPQVVEPKDDVNTRFILAEQADQLELTEADIVFYNTFNQAQSNGEEDSPDSPDSSADFQSPVVVVESVELDNRMDVSNLDSRIIRNNLTHPEGLRPTIPEIGITPPDEPEEEEEECLTEEADEEFETWRPTQSEHDGVAVSVCINNVEQNSESESSEAVTPNSPEKKTKKKRSEAVNGDVKRNKKNKKEEKENISVVSPTSQPTTPTLCEDAKDLSNVSVKELTQAYCSGATKGRLDNGDRKANDFPTGVSIKELKSSFSKFDALSKKTVLHVRSGDASKAQKQFSQASAGPEASSSCRSCSKQVFAMEQVKAERGVWHKNCFRCAECSKQLTVDAYSSHEGVLYCRPHFRELFKPKAVVEDEAPGSDKPDLGLEELSSLNVKSRFQAFEQKPEERPDVERSPSGINVKRSPSILSKLARFQAKGMDVGVTDDSLNGVPLGESSSSEEEEEEDEEGVEREVVRANRKHRERPVSFSKMEDIKGRWESGTSHRREERREERKQEISTIRSRLFMGHQGKMKEAYQQAVSESTATAKEARKDVDVGSDRARSIKERFERGEVANAGGEDEERKQIDEDLVDAGYTRKSRSLFLELDATAAKQAPVSPPRSAVAREESVRKPREVVVVRQVSEDVVRASDAVEEPVMQTEDIGNRFKFFEKFRPAERERRAFRITPPRDGTTKAASPEREIYRDPSIVRADDKMADQEVIRSQTASKMLSLFKQMEESAGKEDLPQGPKPLKRFTPPPDCELNRDSASSDEGEESSEEEEEEEQHNPDIVRSSDKVEDESLKAAQLAAAHAKTLRAKFERWEEREVERERSTGHVLEGLELTAEQAEQSSLDTTKSLRARFESMGSERRDGANAERVQRPKVNRFVEIQTSCAEFCATCEKKVYHLEKVETGGKIFHKNCFRCLHCNCILRMDTYTLNSGRLYCIPHFKQIFFAKGNYEEGFGIDQHKRKWASNKPSDILLSLTAVD